MLHAYADREELDETQRRNIELSEFLDAVTIQATEEEVLQQYTHYQQLLALHASQDAMRREMERQQ